MIEFVECIGRGEIRIRGNSPELKEVARRYGGRRPFFRRSTWVVSAKSEHEVAKCLVALRDAGIAMAGGHSGWPPADVFRDLKSKGLVTGPFREVLWNGPGEAVVHEQE